MPKIVMEHQEEFRTLPADSILHVKVENIEIRTQPGRRGDWEKMEVTFRVQGIQVIGDGSSAEEFASLVGQKIYGGVGFKLTDHPDNKLRQWIEALLGMEIGGGFELDTDYLLGREARAVTRVYDKSTMDPRTGRPYQGMGVESLLPKGGQRSTQAPQQTQQGAPQQAQQSAPSNPWTEPAAQFPPQAQPQPQMSGWGMNGTDDPPF